MVRTMQPRIIPREEHGISRKKISPNALRTLYRLHDNGFIAYLAGGCVRDLLLERTPKDFDIATDAAPGQIKRLFRNCRLVGRRFRLAHLHFLNEILEVSTFRAAAPPHDEEAGETDHNHHPRHLKDEDGMVLRDNVFGTPEEDALRRDFTINALAYNIADFSVIDYSTGLSDLTQRLIRPIGDPFVRFTEDPVRMIRAVRFAASHDLVIEPAAWEVLRELSPTITRAAPARLYEEMLKLFLLGFAGPVFTLLEASGLLDALFPKLSMQLHGNGDLRKALQTNLECLDRLSRRGLPPPPALFLAALFGPGMEAEALARHRDGVPHQQALDVTCALALEEFCKIVCIPGRVGGQLRRILAFQPLLQRRPPRRPSSLVSRPDFADAMSYLYMMAKSGGKDKTALEWWNLFLSEAPSTISSEPPTDEAPAKRRRKKRRRHRSSAQAAV
ncbi:MAG: polynucleotide adenylyltransferase PcnB [Proteobacteria bacterium]|nr:polynucleotide adenylyltransferase PcnB [Pseudomonadota bacterium]MBU1745632.1 polynucleotide adenylyltransferase PcnB [Pseudomonadota bacterium]MBU1965186.1 polynucleotide adenylyltransferase PcnB [Pseudomonadota bacterium]